MATTNLFGHPAFKDGAFTSNDRGVRRAAIGKTMRAIDLGAELGAEVYVFWGGREGTEAGAAKDPRDALERYREAIDVLVRLRRRAGLRPALRDRAQAQRAARRHLPADRRPRAALHHDARAPRDGRREPRGRARDDGRAVASTTASARRCGRASSSTSTSTAQRIGRYDQDFRFGAEDLKEAFLLVRLLERAGYAGPRHFDAHAYRNENAEGVWDFARRLHAHLPRAGRARRAHFDALPEVQEALAAASTPELARAVGRAATRPTRSRPRPTGLDALAERGYCNERLDQLVVEVLLGVR